MKNRAVIFDLEGVILHIDYQKTFEKFAELGIPVQYDGNFKALVEEYDSGRITTQNVYEHFQNLSETPLAYQAFVEAWNAMLLYIPDENLEYLFRLKQSGHMIVILSNINELHARNVEASYGVELMHLVDKTFYSYQIGSLKPEENAFNHAFDFLAEHDIHKENIVFIDDTTLNIHASEALQVRSIKYPMNGKGNEKAISLRSLLNNHVPLFFNNRVPVFQADSVLQNEKHSLSKQC